MRAPLSLSLFLALAALLWRARVCTAAALWQDWHCAAVRKRARRQTHKEVRPGRVHRRATCAVPAPRQLSACRLRLRWAPSARAELGSRADARTPFGPLRNEQIRRQTGGRTRRRSHKRRECALPPPPPPPPLPLPKRRRRIDVVPLLSARRCRRLQQLRRPPPPQRQSQRRPT